MNTRTKPIASVHGNGFNIQSAYSIMSEPHAEPSREVLEQCSTNGKFKPAIWWGDNEWEGFLVGEGGGGWNSIRSGVAWVERIPKIVVESYLTNGVFGYYYEIEDVEKCGNVRELLKLWFVTCRGGEYY